MKNKQLKINREFCLTELEQLELNIEEYLNKQVEEHINRYESKCLSWNIQNINKWNNDDDIENFIITADLNIIYEREQN